MKWTVYTTCRLEILMKRDDLGDRVMHGRLMVREEVVMV
jgi:hypothetical protein